MTGIVIDRSKFFLPECRHLFDAWRTFALRQILDSGFLVLLPFRPLSGHLQPE